MKKMEMKKRDRKPYEKPALRKLSIASSVQTLGTGCKTDRLSGPYQIQCLPSGGSACTGLGS